MSISPTRFKPVISSSCSEDIVGSAPSMPLSGLPHSGISPLGVPHLGLPPSHPPQILTNFNHIRNRKIIKNDEIRVGETFKPKKHFLQPQQTPCFGNNNDFILGGGVSSSNNLDVSPTFSTSSKTRKMLEEVLRNQNELYKKLGKMSPSAKEENDIVIDLEKLPEEEKRKKRLDLIDELIKYNSNNPNFQIPYENCSLNYLNEITSRYRKKHNKEKGKWYIEIFLQLLFFGTEKFLTKMNINAEGFCDFHTKRLNRYETLINELTEEYFSEETGELKLSPGQRFILFIFSQFFLFVAYKFFGENPIFKNILNFFDTTISNTLTNNNNSSVNETGTAKKDDNVNSSNNANTQGFFNNIMTGLFSNSGTVGASTLKSTPVMRQPTSPVVSPSSPKRDSPSKRKKEN